MSTRSGSELFLIVFDDVIERSQCYRCGLFPVIEVIGAAGLPILTKCSKIEQRANDGVDLLRVRLTGCFLHDLAYEKAHELSLSAL